MKRGFKKRHFLSFVFFLCLNLAGTETITDSVTYSFQASQIEPIQSRKKGFSFFRDEDPRKAKKRKDRRVDARDFGILFYEEGRQPFFYTPPSPKGTRSGVLPINMQCLPLKFGFSLDGDPWSKSLSSIKSPHKFCFKRIAQKEGRLFKINVWNGFSGQSLSGFKVVGVVKDQSGKDRLIGLHVDRQGIRVPAEVEQRLRKLIVVHRGYAPKVIFDVSLSSYAIQLNPLQFNFHVKVVDEESSSPILEASIRLQRSGQPSLSYVTDAGGGKGLSVSFPRKEDRLEVYRLGYKKKCWELFQLKERSVLRLPRDSRPINLRFLNASTDLPIVDVNIQAYSAANWLKKDFGSTEYTHELNGNIPAAQTTFSFSCKEFSVESVDVDGAGSERTASGCQVKPGSSPVEITVRMKPEIRLRRLKGKVVDPEGVPLADASVKILCLNKTTALDAKTGSDGVFSVNVTHQEGDAISIAVSHPSYQAAKQDIFKIDEQGLVFPLKPASRSLLVLLNRSERMSRLDFRRLKLAAVEGVSTALQKKGWNSVGLGVFADSTVDWLLPPDAKKKVEIGLSAVKQEIMAVGNYGSTDMAATVKAIQNYILENGLDGTLAKKSRVLLISEVDPVIDLMPSDQPEVREMLSGAREMNTEYYILEYSETGNEFSKTLRTFCDLSGGAAVSFSDRAENLFLVMNETGCFSPNQAQVQPVKQPDIQNTKSLDEKKDKENNENNPSVVE